MLLLLNLRYGRDKAGRVPAAFIPYVDESLARRATAYTLAKGRFSLLADAVFFVILLLTVITGLLGRLDRWLDAWGMGAYLHGLSYVFIVSAVYSVTSLPFTLYGRFVIEKRFGFNTMTPKLFIRDRLVSLLISLAIGVPLLLGLFFFMDTAGRWWWLWAFLLFSLFQIVVSLLYPLVIAPLFNKFTPLPEGALKDKISALLDSLGFRVKGIFIMDGSRRSRHGNAYFTGFGKSKRIVLFDTLLRTLDEDELTAVFAHELGHEKLGHVMKNMILSIVTSGAFFFILSLLLPYRPLYEAFGFAAPGYHSLLVILAVCAGPVTFLLRPLFSTLPRRYEYQADRFAARALGGGAAVLSRALIKLHRDNLSNLHPHPLYSAVYYSHPTPAERVAALETWGGPAP